MNDNIPIIEPTIDHTKVPPIHQKRTVSFINHFIVTTVSFLNKFALDCEEKLYEFENKLQKIEAAVVILESRLASVPGLENLKTALSNTTDCDVNNLEEPTEKEENQIVSLDVDEPDKNEFTKPSILESEGQPISKHPHYEKYFKMVNVGVPKAAVKMKMAQEGLDPALLDDPQYLMPKITDE